MDTSNNNRGLNHFGLCCGPNELLLLVGRVVIFGIRDNNQPEVYGESRLILSLDDRVDENETVGVCDAPK